MSVSTQDVSSVSNQFLDRLARKTILVTGATGYLGTALLSALYAIPCRIVALSCVSTRVPRPNSSEAAVVDMRTDLSKPGVWAEMLRTLQPDLIVNLAAHEHRRGSKHAPETDLAINAATVLDLLETCRELNLKPRIVLASSANLVGYPDRLPVNENTADQPLTLYAIHKLAAENYLKHYAENFGIPGVALRLANVYGPLADHQDRVTSRVVLNRIMLRALEGGPLHLYGNKECLRDFVYVDDVVRALCAAAITHDSPHGSKYVIGSEEGMTLADIVNLIADSVQALGLGRPEVHFNCDAKLDPIEWREFVADCSRMREATGWKPLVKLSDGIRRSLEAFQGGKNS